MDVDSDEDSEMEDEDDDDDYGGRSKKKRTPVARKPPLKKTAAPMKTPQKSAQKTPLKTPTSATSNISSNNSASKFAFSTPDPNRRREDGDNEDENDDEGRNTSSAQKTQVKLPEGVVGAGKHDHDHYTFLQPSHIRDANGRRPDDPMYNPRTLQVPAAFLKDQTPAMAQWWAFKAQNMDTVLFFKVGKFYELFHMDADIGYQQLDLIYMKGMNANICVVFCLL